MSKKILVTGANGYIGRYLVKRLLHQDYEIVALVRDLGKMPAWLLGGGRLTVVEGDLIDKSLLEKAIEGADTVFHLAAALRVFEKDGELYKTNILGLKNLLQACQKASRPIKFIFASSIDAKKRLNTDYGKSKLEGEKIVKNFCQRNPQIKYIIVRIGNVYGGREGGMVEGIRDLIKTGGWRSSILYHELSDQNLSLIKINNLIEKLINLAGQTKMKNMMITLIDKESTVGEIIEQLRKDGLINSFPPRIPLGRSLLQIWQFLGRVLRRADLLIYLNLEK